MKVVLYKRYQASGAHIHWFASAQCCFAPELGAVLYAEQSGSFGGTSIGFNDSAQLVKEGTALFSGSLPDVKKDPNSLSPAPEFSEIAFAELPDEMLFNLLADLKHENLLGKRSRGTMKEILAGRDVRL